MLLHGLFGSKANWGSIARALSHSRHVLTVDLRNHGDSPHASDLSYPAMAADVWSLLQNQGIARPALIGHSMGGKVAMWMALDRPEGLAGLAVVDMAPVRYRHDFNQVFAAFDSVDLAAIGSRADADRMMKTAIGPAGLRAFLLQNLVKQDDAWQWRLNLEVLRQGQHLITDFSPSGGRFDGAAHFIHGALSDYVVDSYRPIIEGFFPAAVYCPVADAGHWVYAEQPERFQRCLTAFLDDVAGSQGV